MLTVELLTTNPMHDIEAVIFDVGEVQFQGLYGAEKLIADLVRKPVTNKQLQTPDLELFFRGAITETQLWQSMIEQFGWETSPDMLAMVVRQNFIEIPGTRKIIELLRARRFKLGLLSVHGKEWVRYIASRFHHHRPFHHISYSYNGGPSKPSAEAFLETARGLGFPPQKCLVVDDYHVNTEAATRAGFQTHLFTNARRLHDELISHDVLVH